MDTYVIILADLLGLDRGVFTAKPWRKFIKRRVLIHMKARFGLCSPLQTSFSHPYVPTETSLCTLNPSEPGSPVSRPSTDSPSIGSEPTPDPSDRSFLLATPCRARSSSLTVQTTIPSCSRIVKTEPIQTDSVNPSDPTSSCLSHSDIQQAIQRARRSEPRDHDLDASVPIKRTEARVQNIILDVCRRMGQIYPELTINNTEEDYEGDVKVKISEIKRGLEGSNEVSGSDHDYDSDDGDDSEDEGYKGDHGQNRTFSPRKTRSDKRKLQDMSVSEEQDRRRFIKTQWTLETRPKTRTCTTQEEIRQLKRLIREVGVRKNWGREFRGRELDFKWQLGYLQTIIHGVKTQQPPYTVQMYQKLRSSELLARKAEHVDTPTELEGSILNRSASELSLSLRAGHAGPEKAMNVKSWRGWRYIMVDDEGNELPDAIWEAPVRPFL
ncbi:hypothetical protein [Phaffia rhodozyma]|uniref:Uncharacterized protein n=1 Tax=Phaffia rhodozyma TaxID=264483 RepID=A0A0F7SWY7_PHARH|nr:hypothetical protein [Phaffia rhodozyma]